MSKIIGIDLGTTNSVVSIIENGEATVIPNSEGKRTTPSIVGFLDGGEKKIGDSAKRQAVTNSSRTVSSIKRFMGKKYDKLSKEIEDCSYEIVKDGELPKVKINDKKYTPQEISAIIIQKMKKTAEDYLGQEVKEAVITVPAYFSDAARTATKEAGEIAGLEVKRIINEPTAASLSYGLDKEDNDKKIAVFDLGGGTFDISILELGGGVFEVKSTNGDTSLGGDDFDQVLIKHLADWFEAENGVNIRKDPMALQRVKESAEKAKIELSSTSETEVNLPYIIPVDGIPKHLVKKITRAEFEKMSDLLLQKLKEPCYKAIKDSGFDISDIDEILLVGGSTRIPSVQNLVKEVFGKEPSKKINPDEAVSLGAAIQAGILGGDVDDVLLLDVTPLSLGIETMGGINTKLVDANTTIPTSKSQVFSTAADNQSEVTINVIQGERYMAKDNKSIGNFNLTNIPPAPRGVPQIEVSFDIDADGILNVKAKDKGTGKEQSIRIDGSSNLDEKEIERMKEEAKANEEKDKKEKEKIETFNKADSLCFQTEKQIKEFGDKLNEGDKTKLKEKVKELKKVHDEKDLNTTKQKMEELNQTWNEISQKMYQKGQNQQNENKDNDKGDDKGDNVEDVDYENVD